MKYEVVRCPGCGRMNAIRTSDGRVTTCVRPTRSAPDDLARDVLGASAESRDGRAPTEGSHRPSPSHRPAGASASDAAQRGGAIAG